MRDEGKKAVSSKQKAEQAVLRLLPSAFCSRPSLFSSLIPPPSALRPRPSSLILAALAICVMLCCVNPAVVLAADKTRGRAERALRDGEFELAEKLFRELLGKNAHDIDARLGLSFALYKQRSLQDAFDHAARVIAVDPLSARAHALLGAAVLASGDFRMAVEEFRTTLSLKDDESLAIAGLAMVDFYENRLGACLEGLRRAVFLNPSEPDYVFNLAQAAARKESYKEAADAYERFLAIAPRTDADRRARIRGLIDFLRYLGRQSSLYIPQGASRTVVPIEMPDNRPVMQVRINGSKEPLRFVLDSGSGMSVISEETAQRLGIRPVARGGMARAVGGGGRFDIVYGFLSSLEVGEVRMENVPVYIRRFFNNENPVDGYIGLSLISKYITTVDYGARTFTLDRRRTANNPPLPSAASPAMSAIEIPVRTTSSGFLSGEVQIKGFAKPLNFIIDTGASISVVSETLAMREEMSGFAEGRRMKVYGAAGVADDVKTLVLPRVGFGSLARESLPAVVLDLESINETAGFEQTGIIGGNFLRHFRVTFDFGRGIVRLEPLTAVTPDSKTSAQMEGLTSQR